MTANPGVVRFAIPIALGVVGVLAIAGCNDAQVTNVWQDRSFRGEIHSVMVVSQDRDPASRRIWEDALCNQMSKDGVEAYSSYQLFPESSPNRDEMVSALHDHGYDAAIILDPMRGEVQRRWVPGYTTTEPFIYYNPWRNRDVVVYRERYHRGYPVTESYDRQQVTLWTPQGDGQMVWAGTVLVPSGDQQRVSDRLADGVVPEMKKAGLI